MSTYKVINASHMDAMCEAVADAIRIKNGTSNKMCFEDFLIGIEEIPDVGALIDKSITTIKSHASSIGQYAFHSCENLIYADFSEAKSISTAAFRSCGALAALIIRSSSICTLSVASAISGSGIYNGNGYVYVPSALVDTYKAATNWSNFAAQFRALEDYTVDGTITGRFDATKAGVTI